MDIEAAEQTASISIHVLRVEDDNIGTTTLRGTYEFQSTSSVWRTTFGVSPMFHAGSHFNPRPPCGGRPWEQYAKSSKVSISIHVLRVEDDMSVLTNRFSMAYFNPRPPCGGRPKNSIHL